MGEYSKLDRVKTMVLVEKLTPFDEILRQIYKNWEIFGYELPTNMQNFTQKDLTEMKIFLKVF